jgi:hypothetical protein
MFGFFSKEKRDEQLISVTEMMSARLREEIIKGNNFKPITVTFDPTEYGHLVGYLAVKTGVNL